MALFFGLITLFYSFPRLSAYAGISSGKIGRAGCWSRFIERRDAVLAGVLIWCAARYRRTWERGPCWGKTVSGRARAHAPQQTSPNPREVRPLARRALPPLRAGFGTALLASGRVAYEPPKSRVRRYGINGLLPLARAQRVPSIYSVLPVARARPPLTAASLRQSATLSVSASPPKCLERISETKPKPLGFLGKL